MHSATVPRFSARLHEKRHGEILCAAHVCRIAQLLQIPGRTGRTARQPSERSATAKDGEKTPDCSFSLASRRTVDGAQQDRASSASASLGRITRRCHDGAFLQQWAPSERTGHFKCCRCRYLQRDRARSWKRPQRTNRSSGTACPACDRAIPASSQRAIRAFVPQQIKEANVFAIHLADAEKAFISDLHPASRQP